MKEEKFELNTLEGQVSLLTDKINGQLDALIVDSNENCEIIIESELGYILFHRRQHLGVVYYCLRSRTTTPVESLMDRSDFDKFNIHEKLIITIRGRKNLDVKLILRLE